MTPSLPDWQARRLSLNIDRIRTQYERNLTSKEPVQQQMATAMWIIDRLALRGGGGGGGRRLSWLWCAMLLDTG